VIADIEARGPFLWSRLGGEYGHSRVKLKRIRTDHLSAGHPRKRCGDGAFPAGSGTGDDKDHGNR
jgi:hypothetical protein